MPFQHLSPNGPEQLFGVHNYNIPLNPDSIKLSIIAILSFPVIGTGGERLLAFVSPYSLLLI